MGRIMNRLPECFKKASSIGDLKVPPAQPSPFRGRARQGLHCAMGPLGKRVLVMVFALMAACAPSASGQGSEEPAPGVFEASSWTTVGSLNHARAEIAAAELGGLLYVAGGFDPTGANLSSLEIYDPGIDQWTLGPSMPIGLNHLGVAAHSGLLYVAGGSGSAGPTTTFLVYNPADGAWSELAPMPLRRSAHVLVSAGERLVVVGGVGDEAGVTLIYDPASGTWTRGTPIPTLREHLSAAAVGDDVYVLGGRWSGVGNVATAEAYHVPSDTWSPLTSMPTPRGGLTAAAVEGRIHVVGGEAFGPDRTFPEHEVYDIATDSWSVAPSLPTPRHGLGSAALDGRIFVIGGGTRAGLSASTVVERY